MAVKADSPVTSFKQLDGKNVAASAGTTAVQLLRTRPIECDQHILADSEISFAHRSNRAGHRNAYSGTLRRIEVSRPDDAALVLISNDLDAPASEIARLYKARWQIELFFKWIKQNLKIKRFLGESENAVRIQLLSALIAYLLVILAKAASGCSQSLKHTLDELRTGPFLRPQQEQSSWHRRRERMAHEQTLQPSLFK